METDIGPRKSGSWLVLVAILSVCVAQLASPQSAQAHPSQVQGVAHPQNVGPPVGNPLPPNQRFSPGRQTFFGDAACNAPVNAFFAGDSSDSLFGNQQYVFSGKLRVCRVAGWPRLGILVRIRQQSNGWLVVVLYGQLHLTCWSMRRLPGANALEAFRVVLPSAMRFRSSVLNASR